MTQTKKESWKRIYKMQKFNHVDFGRFIKPTSDRKFLVFPTLKVPLFIM